MPPKKTKKIFSPINGSAREMLQNFVVFAMTEKRSKKEMIEQLEEISVKFNET